MVIDSALRQRLLAPAVYYYVRECMGDISEELCQALLREWSIDREQFDRFSIRRAPTRLQNLFVAFECHKKFGSEVLKAVPGFYQAENTYSDPLWWMDIDPHHSRNGFILPELNPKYKFIDRLRIYRSPKDSEGFLLTTREECHRRAA